MAGMSLHAGEAAGKQFLRFIYDGDANDIAKICITTNDLWMLPGRKDDAALKMIGEMDDSEFKNGVVSGMLGTSFYFFEIRDDLVDPTFYLESVYTLHRRLARQFLLSSLTQNERTLGRFATHPGKITFSGDKVNMAEVGVYGEAIGSFPVVRTSKPEEDAKSRSVTYRLPLGTGGLELKMIKSNSFWKIDTSDGLTVPLEFFSRRAPRRPIEYNP